MDFLQTWQGLLWTLWCLLTGLVLGWVWSSAPLKSQIEFLQSAGMERVLLFEDLYRKEQEKVQVLESDLKFAKARTLALESDLERIQSKYLWKD